MIRLRLQPSGSRPSIRLHQLRVLQYAEGAIRERRALRGPPILEAP